MQEERKALPKHKTATSEKAWDGPGNEANLKTDQDLDYYKKAYAWWDPEGDPSNKSSYKFIHHEVSTDGTPGAANIKGCQSGIGVLNGAMGGTKIPEADYQGVWNHLASHLRDADIEPAPLGGRSFAPEDIETRMFESIEFRQAGDNAQPVIVGYAAVFNKLSLDLGGFREKIAPGAFTRTLKDVEAGKRVVNSLFNHDRNWLLATTANGSLRLKEDEKGLYTEMEPIITTMNGHPINLIRAKAVRGMSFGFSVMPDGRESWDFAKAKEPVRTLEDVDLYDASPVVEPAYPQTSVKVRDYLKAILEAGEVPDEQGALEHGRTASLEILKRRIDIAEKS